MTILAIDQGTTSSRAILFDAALRPLAQAGQEFAQIFPRPGWVEHDPDEIWASVAASVQGALARAGKTAAEITALGLTNQRETTVIWERATGRPIHNAIVWQDRRTAETCAALAAEGHEGRVRARTGLVLDPYFSATKIAWILDHVPGARARAEAGDLAFGTVDAWLIWRLTGGRVHATDATNAARTLLYDIVKGEWCPELCALFGVPMAMLPEVRDSAGDFGRTRADLFGAEIPIRGVAGDQQAAAVGQACFAPGMMKATYGTGCFALLNTGEVPVFSRHRMLTTVALQLDGTRTYAIEGAIFIAGAVVQWLRDGLKMIAAAPEVGPLAEAADPGGGVVFVPAFTGLGAPYWAPECRGAIFGLSRGAGRPEIARAALESVGQQTADLWEAMRADWAEGAPGAAQVRLRVDGGMAASDWTMQALADLLGAEVDRPAVLETTALGAAWLAARGAGLGPSRAEFSAAWALERRFAPRMAPPARAAARARWARAVQAVLDFGG